MKKYTNILSQPHLIHLDKLQIQIDNNSIINFEPSNPIRLKKVEHKKKYSLIYKETYEIQTYHQGAYFTVAYLNHQMRLHPQISKITLTSKFLYSDWSGLLKTILSKLNINENYRVSNIEIALDTNVDLLNRYYSMLYKNQIILDKNYSNPVYVQNATNRFNTNISGDTLYIHKLNKKGQIVHYNKTRIEDKSNQLQSVNKPHITAKLSKIIDINKPHFRIEQLINFLDYSDSTRNKIYEDIEGNELSQHHYNKLNDYDKWYYSKGSRQISFDDIKIDDLINPIYLMKLFKYFAKFNLEYYLGSQTIEPIEFPDKVIIFDKYYKSTDLGDVLFK